MKLGLTKENMGKETRTGWGYVRLEEICETTSGGTPSRDIAEFYNGEIPWVKSGELKDGWIYNSEEKISLSGLKKSSAKLFPTGTLLIAMYGANIGRVGILGIDAATNQAVCAISMSEAVDRDFLFWHLFTERWNLTNRSFGGAQPNISQNIIRSLKIPLPPLIVQKRISAILNEQMAAVERARKAAQDRLEAAMVLPASFIRKSTSHNDTRRLTIDEALIEVKNGVGSDWGKYRLVGATRGGIAPAKEGVGKSPERYKLVDPGTVFYNPMRILLGSIAMVDEDDEAGITSPDYVAVKGREGILDTRWFYFWFRSAYGAHLIDSLTRGAVRERILFNRLSKGEINLPDYNVQKAMSKKLKECQKIIEIISNEIATIDALPSILIRKAFKGEI